MKKVFLTLAFAACVASLSAQTTPAPKKAETKKECCTKEKKSSCSSSADKASTETKVETEKK